MWVLCLEFIITLIKYSDDSHEVSASLGSCFLPHTKYPHKIADPTYIISKSFWVWFHSCILRCTISIQIDPHGICWSLSYLCIWNIYPLLLTKLVPTAMPGYPDYNDGMRRCLQSLNLTLPFQYEGLYPSMQHWNIQLLIQFIWKWNSYFNAIELITV